MSSRRRLVRFLQRKNSGWNTSQSKIINGTVCRNSKPLNYWSRTTINSQSISLLNRKETKTQINHIWHNLNIIKAWPPTTHKFFQETLVLFKIQNYPKHSKAMKVVLKKRSQKIYPSIPRSFRKNKFFMRRELILI